MISLHKIVNFFLIYIELYSKLRQHTYNNYEVEFESKFILMCDVTIFYIIIIINYTEAMNLIIINETFLHLHAGLHITHFRLLIGDGFTLLLMSLTLCLNTLGQIPIFIKN